MIEPTPIGEGLRWGIIGASWIAEAFVIPAIRSVAHSEVVGVYSSSPARAAGYATTVDVDVIWSSLEEGVNDERVDAVFVSSLNNLHHRHVLAAARAGKHVLCEKPLALTVEQAIRMRDACQSAGVVMATNHAFRDQVPIGKMRSMIANGDIGVPVAARTFFGVNLIDRIKTWRLTDPRSGGVLRDVTVHTVDILRFLLDAEVIEVHAQVENQGMASAGVEDIVTGTLRFNTNLLSNFHDSYTVNHVPSSVEVHGTKGSLLATDVLSVHPSGELFLYRNGESTAVDAGPLESPYVRTVRAFTHAVLGGGSPTATAEDGIRSLQTVNAAHESARTGRRVKVEPLKELGPRPA